MGTDPVQFMSQEVKIDYRIRTNPNQATYQKQLRGRKIIGHRCPGCEFVYVPPRGYCPMCVVVTSERDEVEVADVGTVTSFTVIRPIQYHGQEETDPYALASILLDGSGSTLGQQRLAGVDPETVRTGMRVKADWLEEESGGGFQIAAWSPSEEPDVSPESVEEHVS